MVRLGRRLFRRLLQGLVCLSAEAQSCARRSRKTVLACCREQWGSRDPRDNSAFHERTARLQWHCWRSCRHSRCKMEETRRMLWPFPGDPRHNSTSYEETNLSSHSAIMLPSRQNTRAAFLHLQLTSIISRHHGPPSAIMGRASWHQAPSSAGGPSPISPPCHPSASPSALQEGVACPRPSPSIPVPVPVPPFPVSQPPSLCGWNVSVDGSAAGHAIVWENKKNHASHQSTTPDPGKKTDARPSLVSPLTRFPHGPPLLLHTHPPVWPTWSPPIPLSLHCPPPPPPPCHPLGDSAELLS